MKMNTNSTYRSVFLDCLRENAANMRREHQDLAERISIALAKSRANLQNVERINRELQKMKITVNDALHNVRGNEGPDEIKGACSNLLSSLIEEVANSGSASLSQVTEDISIVTGKAPMEVNSSEQNIDAPITLPIEAPYNTQELKANFASENGSKDVVK